MARFISIVDCLRASLSMPMLAAIASLFCIAACNQADLAKASASQGIINYGYAWPGGRVEVCFLNSSGDPDGELAVEKAVTANFSKKRTGIEFFGFKPCERESTAQAKVLFGVPRAYSLFIGSYRMGFGQAGETIGLPSFNKSELFYFYNTAVHEFGHFAGLFHAMHDASNDNGKICSRGDYSSLCQVSAVLPGSFPLSLNKTYDRSSIMNYCVQGYFSEYLQLSTGDEASLSVFYGVDGKNEPMTEDEYLNNPANTCLIIEVAPRADAARRSGIDPLYSDDGRHVPAFWDESLNWSSKAGDLAVGSILMKIRTNPWVNVTPKNSENITSMQVVPFDGPLAGKRVWILGNATRVVRCLPK